MDRTNAERQARFRERQRRQIEAGAAAAEGLARLKAELTRARARIAELEHRVASQKPQTARSAKPPPDPNSEILRLRKALREERRKNTELMRWHEKKMDHEGKMSLPTFRAITTCLNGPPPTEAARAEACKLFNAWRTSERRAPRAG